eukprot:CAMPEP_0182884202 /NCGR_PEP_ID=MMETSP0034_2-20130328/18850_1 /TAXON_ID=156128 /ORGANISM="Nephroselmis pyriformis, Strain CCMP717" /LENGTH=211 /DNA_ID=CAMNT_0025017381 /DNA_START=3 /DNA_END=638 /DNA_ORIENTATION=+
MGVCASLMGEKRSRTDFTAGSFTAAELDAMIARFAVHKRGTSSPHHAMHIDVDKLGPGHYTMKIRASWWGMSVFTHPGEAEGVEFGVLKIEADEKLNNRFHFVKGYQKSQLPDAMWKADMVITAPHNGDTIQDVSCRAEVKLEALDGGRVSITLSEEGGRLFNDDTFTNRFTYFRNCFDKHADMPHITKAWPFSNPNDPHGLNTMIALGGM